MVTKIFLSPQVQPSDISNRLRFSLEGYIDVVDGCLSRYALECTTLGC